MALADDLLWQAEHLAKLDAGMPTQANLRRALSAAYYALFHLLIAAAIQRHSPASPPKLGSRIARAFVYTEMRQVCSTICNRHKSAIFEELQPTGFSDELRSVAKLFVMLQQGRHRADYDLEATYERAEVQETIAAANTSFATWEMVKNSNEANVFLAALLFGARWAQ